MSVESEHSLDYYCALIGFLYRVRWALIGVLHSCQQKALCVCEFLLCDADSV